jgi:hypothetical protein
MEELADVCFGSAKLTAELSAPHNLLSKLAVDRATWGGIAQLPHRRINIEREIPTVRPSSSTAVFFSNNVFFKNL